jgi:PAS domain S-box-containing protein
METEIFADQQKDYQTIARSITEYVIAINRNYQVIMANELFKNEFGMHPNKQCYYLWKKRNEKCEKCFIEQTFQDGKEHWNIEDVVMKDGRIVKMLIKSIPVKNDKNEIAYVMETATNITQKESIQAEIRNMAGNLEKTLADRLQKLQESEEKYRTIFERSRDAIILIDREAKIIEINDAGVYILGYNNQKEVLELESAFNIFENLDFDKLRKKVVRNGFVLDFETRLLGKNSRRFDALITANIIVEITGQISGYVLIIRDITKRKIAQRQIEKRNVQLDALNMISKTVNSSLKIDDILRSTINIILEVLESDSVRIYLLDEGKTNLELKAHKGLSAQLINEPFIKCRKLGDGLLGQAVLHHKTKLVDNFLRADDPYVDSILEEGLHNTAYIPLSTKGESIGVMCVSSHSPVKLSSGYIEFLSAIGNQIGVAVDNANLYENKKKAYEELKEAQEQVIHTEKLASLGKLAATIAHEINNPLAVVLTYIRLIKKLIDRNRFSSERLGDIGRYLTTMDSETSKCGEIVKNLLAFSRCSNIMIERHQIAHLIDRVLSLIAHDLEMKGIELKTEINQNLPLIRCDSKQVQQAILNLIYNASDAMQSGGILTVKTDQLALNDKYVNIVISDTGHGISNEDQKKIFDPFFTTKEEGKGVGLGLSIVYGVITRHNGKIEVESEPGKGSTFRMSLPL